MSEHFTRWAGPGVHAYDPKIDGDWDLSCPPDGPVWLVRLASGEAEVRWTCSGHCQSGKTRPGK